MVTITLEEARARLAERVHRLGPGEGVMLTEDDRPVARLVTVPAAEAARPLPGRCRGMLTVIAEDDEHRKDWAESMRP